MAAVGGTGQPITRREECLAAAVSTAWNATARAGETCLRAPALAGSSRIDAA